MISCQLLPNTSAAIANDEESCLRVTLEDENKCCDCTTTQRKVHHNDDKKKNPARAKTSEPCSEFLQVGEELGKGAFCEVLQVETNHKAFALKRLRPWRTDKNEKPGISFDDYISGAQDLAAEADLLSKLNHENIIRIHDKGYRNTGDHDGFYMLLDRLDMTLMDRIKLWKVQAARKKSISTAAAAAVSDDKCDSATHRHGPFHRRRSASPCVQKSRGSSPFRRRRSSPFRRRSLSVSPEDELELLKERMTLGLQLARAVRYLHSQNVVHRDIKPENIGFDEDGILKLFDFGSAAQLSDGDGYLLGESGTLSFMAPEMALNKSYDGRAVDVYAFGLVLWEMCALERAFDGYSERRIMTKVVQKGERPRIPSRLWPKPLQNLLRRCWAAEAEDRPTMAEVVGKLEEIVNQP